MRNMDDRAPHPGGHDLAALTTALNDLAKLQAQQQAEVAEAIALIHHTAALLLDLIERLDGQIAPVWTMDGDVQPAFGGDGRRG